MEEAFGIVLFGVVLLAVVVAVVSMASQARAYDEIGKGGLSLRDGTDRPAQELPAGMSAGAAAEAEVRQMVEAKNLRRARRGLELLDVEAEVRKLTAGPDLGQDLALVQEVRELVEARNARRVRRGEEPLDVEEEVQRQLRALG